MQFFDNVKKTNGCWEWTRGKTSAGYGAVWWGGKTEAAHRLSYRLHRGPIPEGMYVCHSCDNPACVNPDHLWLGSLQDNHKDMMLKEREYRGSQHHTTQITEDDVVAMRNLRASGMTPTEIANIYGLKRPMVSHICTGRNWKHAGGPVVGRAAK